MKTRGTQSRRSQQQVVRRIDALGLVALQIDWQNKVGTPEEAEAKAMLDDAKELWREQGRGRSGELTESALDEARALYRAACGLMRNKSDKNCWHNLENAAHRFNAAHQRARNASA